MAATVITVKDLSSELKTEGRVLRRHLRSVFGYTKDRGSKTWALTPKEVATLKAKFGGKVQEKKGSKKAPKLEDLMPAPTKPDLIDPDLGEQNQPQA
jgi:hypothetical protein